MLTAEGDINCLFTNKEHDYCNLPIDLQSQKTNKNLSHVVLSPACRFQASRNIPWVWSGRKQ